MNAAKDGVLKKYKQHFKSAGALSLGLFILWVLTGCPGSPSPPVITAPIWNRAPEISSAAKGQFTVKAGEAVGTAPLVLSYYWAGPGVEPPPLGGQAAPMSDWTDAGWIKLESFDEPITELKIGGQYTVYGVAKNSGGFKRTSASTTVGEPVGPKDWSKEPAIDQTALSHGQLLITAGAVQGDGGAALDPAADIRYYYAAVGTNLPDKDRDADWTGVGWIPIAADVELTPVPGDYAVHAVVSNNGGALRHDLGSAQVSANNPMWLTMPQVETSDLPGVFTLTDGGTVGGNPYPDDLSYYYAVDDYPPTGDDIANPDSWTNSPKKWKKIEVGETATGLVPASREYKLYGVAKNTDGAAAALSGEIKFLVKGFSGWDNENSDSKESQLSEAAILGYNEDILILGGDKSGTYQTKIWRGKFQNSRWEWTSLDTGMTKGIAAPSALKDEGGNIYIIGGKFSGTEFSDKVWKGVPSGDSFTWTELTDDANWSEGRWTARWGASVAYHDGTMYLMGGTDQDGNTYNDVWKSLDGRNWTELTSAAEWSIRRNSAAVSHDGRLWMLGGLKGGSARVNDVWYSTGSGEEEVGVSWVQATEEAEWSDRDELTAVSFKNRIWVMGGRESSSSTYLDVWHSEDGISWEKAEDVGLSGFKSINGAVVFDDSVVLRDNSAKQMAGASWIE